MPNSACKIPSRYHVAGIIRTADNMDVLESEIRAIRISTKDVVVFGVTLRGTGNILHQNISDDDTIAGYPCCATVQIIGLDVDAIDGDVVDGDIFVCDAVYPCFSGQIGVFGGGAAGDSTWSYPAM